jgi:hypothetical protein
VHLRQRGWRPKFSAEFTKDQRREFGCVKYISTLL